MKILIENPANVVERQKIRTEDLKKLIQEKYLIKKKTDVIVEDLFLNKQFVVLIVYVCFFRS